MRAETAYWEFTRAARPEPTGRSNSREPDSTKDERTEAISGRSADGTERRDETGQRRKEKEESRGETKGRGKWWIAGTRRERAKS